MIALAKAAAAPDFPAEIIAVIADKADAGGLDRRPGSAFRPRLSSQGFCEQEAHEGAILAELDRSQPT